MKTDELTHKIAHGYGQQQDPQARLRAQAERLEKLTQNSKLKLGEGSFNVVYKDPADPRWTWRITKQNLRDNKDLLATAQQEIGSEELLGAPNVHDLPIFDEAWRALGQANDSNPYFKADGRLAAHIERFDGDLTAYCKAVPYDWKAARSLVIDIARQCFKRGKLCIFDGDIKPENILVKWAGHPEHPTVMLADLDFRHYGLGPCPCFGSAITSDAVRRNVQAFFVLLSLLFLKLHCKDLLQRARTAEMTTWWHILQKRLQNIMSRFSLDVHLALKTLMRNEDFRSKVHDRIKHYFKKEPGVNGPLPDFLTQQMRSSGVRFLKNGLPTIFTGRRYKDLTFTGGYLKASPHLMTKLAAITCPTPLRRPRFVN